ncbi:Fc.00g067290.m01.CDS01 [Cosmosporella sp. VM-42]
MPVKSLVELATAAVLKNIRELESVGDYLPYENVRHILLKVDNAHQLRQIEVNSPQVEGETGEIWLKIIEREFPMEYKAKAYKPQNPKKWYRVWEKYKKDHDQALEDSERKLMDALGALKQEREKNTSRIVDRKLLPRPPGPTKRWGQRDTSGSQLLFGRGSRTKTANGASVMRKVRREVKEIASIHGNLSRPVRGSSALTKLKKAPAGMVINNRLAAQPVFRPTPKEAYQSAAVTEYEERATFLSDSEGDEDDNELFDDGEEDYDEPPPPRPAPKPMVKSSSTSLMKKLAAARPAPSSSKRPGLLSNSYNGPTAKPQQSSTPNARSTSKPSQSGESSRPERILPRTQTSPPPAPAPGPSSSPPLAQSAPSALGAPPRKRKATSIFMSRKKR